jgi:hypothetical protein
MLSAVPRFAGGRHHTEGHRTLGMLARITIRPLLERTSGLLVGWEGFMESRKVYHIRSILGLLFPEIAEPAPRGVQATYLETNEF